MNGQCIGLGFPPGGFGPNYRSREEEWNNYYNQMMMTAELFHQMAIAHWKAKVARSSGGETRPIVDPKDDPDVLASKEGTGYGAMAMPDEGDLPGGGEADQSGGATGVSQSGIDFIKSYEKLRLNPYDASGSAGRGDWTIGWGHKILPGESFSGGITAAQAEQLFLSDLQNKAVAPILKYVNVPLSQQQFDALASYVFNVGPGNSLVGTNLIRHLNAGNYAGAALQIDIATQGGVYMQGLYNRRMAEQQIWNNGIYNLHR